MKEGKYDDALAAFDNAADKDTNSAGPGMPRKANLCLGNFDKAISECNAAINGDPKLADAYYTGAGLAQQELTKRNKAADDFSKAVDLDPDRPDFLAARGANSQQLAATVASDQAAKLMDNPRRRILIAR